MLLFCELGSEFPNVFRKISGFRSSHFAEHLFVLALNFHDCPYSGITRRDRQTDRNRYHVLTHLDEKLSFAALLFKHVILVRSGFLCK